jgi:tripeptide aminopeptidase
MESVKNRFLRYVKIDTQSQLHVEQVPSTEKQLVLSRLLRDELIALGASDVALDPHGYVTATIPANTTKIAPVIGLLSHVDTSDAVTGANVNPQLTPNYAGGDIEMGNGYVLSPAMFPSLLTHIGEEIISTDGSTLLGADDKAGVAEIMTFAEQMLSPNAPEHGTIRIGFTPDEEVGRGVDLFDVPAFGADFAFTVDGGALGEINYECFNAASAEIRIRGISAHTGSAKGRMVNASLLAMELHAMLPALENPSCTDEYEGFFHLERLESHVESAYLYYLLRDHDAEKFAQKKTLIEKACAYLNEKYGEGTASIEVKDTYYNMKPKIPMYVVDAAKCAMESLGIEPNLAPIRGGTDGSRLSYMGLPCPNLCTGGHNFHGRYEFISTQVMEKVVQILEVLIPSFVK